MSFAEVILCISLGSIVFLFYFINKTQDQVDSYRSYVRKLKTDNEDLRLRLNKTITENIKLSEEKKDWKMACQRFESEMVRLQKHLSLAAVEREDLE